jgi:hypothetical protein
MRLQPLARRSPGFRASRVPKPGKGGAHARIAHFDRSSLDRDRLRVWQERGHLSRKVSGDLTIPRAWLRLGHQRGGALDTASVAVCGIGRGRVRAIRRDRLERQHDAEHDDRGGD